MRAEAIVPCRNLCRDGVVDGGRHLTCGKPLPDERIEAELIAVQVVLHLCGRAQDTRRTDCLVRILCLLPHRVDIGTRRNILLPVLLTEKTACLIHGKI